MTSAGCRFLPNSVDLLREASELRAQGRISPEVQLWAVGNPVIEPDAHRMELKAAAGATVFLTQPPLAWGRFETWMEDARRRELLGNCKIIIGLPMLTSATHLQFWMQLCGAAVEGVMHPVAEVPACELGLCSAAVP